MRYHEKDGVRRQGGHSYAKGENVSDKTADMHAPHRQGLRPLGRVLLRAEAAAFGIFTASLSVLDQHALNITLSLAMLEQRNVNI